AETATRRTAHGRQLAGRSGAVHLCGRLLLRLSATGYRCRRAAAVRRRTVEHAALGLAARRTPEPDCQPWHGTGHSRPAGAAAAGRQRPTAAGCTADAAGRGRLGSVLPARTRPG